MSQDESPTSLSLATHLSQNRPIILDGALATYLETLGADISSALWSADLLLKDPELIYRTHLDYFRAGADVAITASYQASTPGLTKHLAISEDEAKDVVRKSVELAKRARDDYLAELDAKSGESELQKRKLWIAGSVGPYGAFLADGSEYRGDYTLSKASFKDFHRGRMQALVESGVDVLACETMPSLPEVSSLLELLREEFPDTQAWLSFTLRDSEHVSDGSTLSSVADVLAGSGQIVALGANCVPEDSALEALKGFQRLTNKALVVYPNSGELWNAETRCWQGQRNQGDRLAGRTKEWYGAGARLIGGCCRTTPEDIRTICQALRGAS